MVWSGHDLFEDIPVTGESEEDKDRIAKITVEIQNNVHLGHYCEINFSGAYSKDATFKCIAYDCTIHMC
jgi:hypothetical protein